MAEPPLRSIRPMPRGADYRKVAAPTAEALIAKAGLGGRTAFAVADARTGLVLEAVNPLLPQPPASVAKVLTSLYALDALGPGFQFRTRLVATGPVQNGRIEGDLVLVGSGDPELDTDMLADLAASLKAAGVREVAGKFRYFANALPQVGAIDPGQPDHVGYNPAISGLNLNFNRVHFEWHRAASGYDVTMDARARRFRPRVATARMRVVDRAVPIYTYDDVGGVDDWTVASRALGKEGSRWLPVRRPSAYAAEVFQTLARSHGIELGAPAEAAQPPAGQVLAEHQSAPLRDILRGMLKYSTNMTAEVLGVTASNARGARPSTLAGSAQVMSRWLIDAMDARRADFTDHSGLGSASRISAGDMVRVLVKAGPESMLADLMKTIPMRDSKGRPVKDHPVKVRAKTGTLNFVSGLAGYVTAADGTELAFAIFSADEDRRAALPPEQRERPKGGQAWARRARAMQLDLIERWALLYGT